MTITRSTPAIPLASMPASDISTVLSAATSQSSADAGRFATAAGVPTVYSHTPAVSISGLQGGTVETSLRDMLAARKLERKDEKITFQSVVLSHVEWVQQAAHSNVAGDLNSLFMIEADSEQAVKIATRTQLFLLKESVKPVVKSDTGARKRFMNALSRALHRERAPCQQLAQLQALRVFAWKMPISYIPAYAKSAIPRKDAKNQ